MNKPEFIKIYSEKTQQSKKDSTIQVDAFLECLKNGLKSEGKVGFIGDVILEVKDTKPRTCRNPKSGEEIQVPAGKRLSIKCGKTFNTEVLGK